MRLTANQVAVFGNRAQSEFMTRALEYLCNKHAQICAKIGRERMQAILDLSLERCRAHHAASEKCVVALADLSLTRTRDVYVSEGYVQEILASEEIDVSQKARRLMSYL